jgi:hypothetical protein
MKRNMLNKILRGTGFQTSRCVKLLATCGLLLVVSCKARKPLIANRVPDTAVKTATNKENKIKAIKARQIYFSTFSAKAKTKLDIGGNSNDVTLNIRINRGQKIWVSITAIAGIEVARALITPDSIIIMNRLQSVYIKKQFDYIYTFTGNQINYKTLESLLVGNAIPELLNDDAALQSDSSKTTLTGNLRGLLYKLLIGPDMKVTQTNLNDQSAGQSLQVTNNTFIQAGNRVVPSQIDMASVVKDKKIEVNLHYVKVEFDQPLEYPFSIPSRYTPVN